MLVFTPNKIKRNSQGLPKTPTTMHQPEIGESDERSSEKLVI